MLGEARARMKQYAQEIKKLETRMIRLSGLMGNLEKTIQHLQSEYYRLDKRRYLLLDLKN